MWRLTRGCFSHMASNRVPCAVLHRLRRPKTDIVLAEPPSPVGSGMTAGTSGCQRRYVAPIIHRGPTERTIEGAKSARVKAHVHAQVVRLERVCAKIGGIGKEVQVRDERGDGRHCDFVVELGCSAGLCIRFAHKPSRRSLKTTHDASTPAKNRARGGSGLARPTSWRIHLRGETR